MDLSFVSSSHLCHSQIWDWLTSSQRLLPHKNPFLFFSIPLYNISKLKYINHIRVKIKKKIFISENNWLNVAGWKEDSDGGNVCSWDLSLYGVKFYQFFKTTVLLNKSANIKVGQYSFPSLLADWRSLMCFLLAVRQIKCLSVFTNRIAKYDTTRCISVK